MLRKVALDPRHHQRGEAIDLLIAQFPAFGDMMPFLDAASAAGGGGMLSGEHRMPSPRRLPAVVARLRVPHPGAQHVMGMPVDHRFALGSGIGAVLVRQHEFRSELGLREPAKRLLHPYQLLSLVHDAYCSRLSRRPDLYFYSVGLSRQYQTPIKQYD